MELRTIIIGIVTTIVVLVFIVFGLRACTRDSTPAASSAVGGGAAGSTGHLTECVADPETGLCFPKENNQTVPFDWDNFMATVREHQMSSSSSSSRSSRAGFFGGASLFSSSRGASSSSFAELSVSDMSESSSSVSSLSGPDFDAQSNDPATARVIIIGEGEDELAFDEGNDGDGTANDPGNGANDSENGAGDAGGFQGYQGLQGSRGPLPSGKCNRGRSLLAIFDEDDVTTGTTGTALPSVLIDGDCPVSGAMLKGPDHGGGFGGPLNDF
ncbi:MAG: hypothetical protein HOO67_06720 [Candidatus Peribacteraceae bacterium]|nr:hypothetical protein [Candidatus Peribacteraceae bacterium]